MKPHVSPKGKAPVRHSALSPSRLTAKALIGQTIPSIQAAAIRGGDDNGESYPWVDKP